MPIRLFHITYDADSSKYPNAMEDIIEVLCKKCYVKEIGHPLESTFVFKMASSEHDVESIKKALITSFPKDFWFVVSRVACAKKHDTDVVIEHFAAKPSKEHTDAFFTVLTELKNAQKIGADVKSLSMS